MSRDEDSITIYSDYVCPFCYLGRESLAEYEEKHGMTVDIEVAHLMFSIAGDGELFHPNLTSTEHHSEQQYKKSACLSDSVEELIIRKCT